MVRAILNEPSYKDSERAPKQLGDFMIRYLKGEIPFARAQNELAEDFPLRQ